MTIRAAWTRSVIALVTVVVGCAPSRREVGARQEGRGASSDAGAPAPDPSSTDDAAVARLTTPATHDAAVHDTEIDAAASPAVVTDAATPARSGADALAHATDTSPGPAPPPPARDTNGWLETVMMVGYGGVRVISQDQGRTWKKIAQLEPIGGDDMALLRGVAYGNGTWVATGWRRFTWTPSVAPGWVEDKRALAGCGIMEGVAYGNGVFVGACGDQSFVSVDGQSWNRGGVIGGTGGHPYVVFAEGRFAASGDGGQSFTSADGKTWAPLPGIHAVVVCDGALRSQESCFAPFSVHGTYLRMRFLSVDRYDPATKTWVEVYKDDARNGGYRLAAGFLPPM